MSTTTKKKDAAPELRYRYTINIDAMEADGVSFTQLAALRFCGEPSCKHCKKPLKQRQKMSRGDTLKAIAQNCSQQETFTSPMMPLLEVVFRLLLASGNQPLRTSEIIDCLKATWGSIIHLKDTSARTVANTLEGGNDYFIERIPD